MFSRKTAVITTSDKGFRGEREDRSGQALVERLEAEGFEVFFKIVIPDEYTEIRKVLADLADGEKPALILTTGGTGVSPRDVTPEATLSVIERAVPGMAEAMRAAGLENTPHAMISRAVAGIRGKTLIVNLPGKPERGARKPGSDPPALPHALDKIQGDPSDCAQSR